jgi:ATP-dependent helicase/nuclease subunit A
MESGRSLPWREWGSLGVLNANRPYAFVAGPVQQAAAAHDDHPRFHDDVTTAIDLVFTLAARTLDAYEAQKRRWGVIDFVDQEAYALALLRRRDVADRLAEDLDLVMVDEFQDTSPLQLAIFLELAQIAPRSVWVGDQKQSIYGFRGTDPELMDAALELLERRDPAFVDDTLAALFEQTTPTTLEASWRSRPGLVDLTSELFAAAFEPHGIPPDRVKLRPGLTTEPTDLGPIVEVWDLQIPNSTQTTLYPTALPSALEALLGDETNVRDRVTGEARRVRLSDIAVLSRRHATSQRVAAALEGRGHRVVLPRPGLLRTAEGRLALAALRRWADPHDALAGAEIDRLTRYADAPDAWLRSLAVRDEALEVCPAVAAIDSARAIDPGADPLTAFERCMAEVGLRELCPRWGEARQRLGNLDALRSAAVSYVSACASERSVASVAGLLADFELLAEEETDVQAVLAGDEAVTLCTWHAAKGLEWPITVLFDLDWSPPGGVTGVEVEPGRPRLDLRDPLADRWIRYLPQPFLWNQRKVPFIARAESMEFAQRANERHEREQLRLLYVAWTRARDRLVLAGPAGKMYGKILASLRNRSGPLLSPPRREGAVWGGCRVEVLVRPAVPAERRRRSTEPGHAYELRAPREFPPAWLNPSAIMAPGVAVDVVEIAAPFVVTAVDPQALGEAVHAFFAADDHTHVAERRVAFAAEQLRRWGVVCPGLELHLVTAADALAGLIETRWPGARVRREVPVWHTLASGTILRGSADVIVELGSAYAVIDHKVMVGSGDRVVLDAVAYAGQLAAYADAITAANPTAMVSSFVHLPLAGRIIELFGDRSIASP